MEKTRLMKIAPLLLIILVGLTASGVALSTWFNFNLVPWHLPSLTLENPFSLIVAPEMLNAQGSITGSGIVNQEHDYTVSITNIRTYGDGEPYLVDGSYVYGLWDDTDTLVETITTGMFENLPYGSSHMDLGVWTPTVSADDYTIKLKIESLNWHHSPSEMTVSSVTETLGAFSLVSYTLNNDPPVYTCIADTIELSFTIENIIPDSEIATFSYTVDIMREDLTGRYTVVDTVTIVIPEMGSYLHLGDQWTSPTYSFNAPATSGNWIIEIK